MKAIIPIFLALALAARGTAGAADFFGVPEKTIVPKPAPATPAPATPAPAPATPAPTRGPATPVPITSAPVDDTPPTLLPDGTYLKTPSIGDSSSSGRAFRDVGPDNGVVIGFSYSTGTTAQGGSVINSLTPLFLRPAGKAHGTLRGTLKPGSPATVLEARPGFAVAAVEARGATALEAFRITFMRYENGALDPAERYTTKWIGSEGTEPGKQLRTDTRPIIGIYGKADAGISEFGLLVRREIPPKVAGNTFFGTPVSPDPGTVPVPEPEMPDEPAPAATQLEPTAFDPAILTTPVAGGANKKYGTPYRDLAPPGAFLAGFDYTVGTWNKKSVITSLRPLYVLNGGSARRLGDLHGTPTGEAQRVDARPTYAVGAIVVRDGVLIDGFQLVYMKMRGAALDPADSYLSEWFGGTGGGKKRLDGGGQPFVGLYGAAGKEVNSLALLVKKGAEPGLASVPSSLPNPPATPAPVPTTAGIEIFAVADDSFTLFHNGKEVLSGSNLRNVESGTFPLVKGDVLTAIVKDKGGSGGEAWFSLRVVRDGKTILDAGDMRYTTSEMLNWKTNKLTTGFREPKVWTHEKQMGADKRPRAAWANAKDANATVLYFKGIVP